MLGDRVVGKSSLQDHSWGANRPVSEIEHWEIVLHVMSEIDWWRREKTKTC
jgi:hypothetical protein